MWIQNTLGWINTLEDHGPPPFLPITVHCVCVCCIYCDHHSLNIGTVHTIVLIQECLTLKKHPKSWQCQCTATLISVPALWPRIRLRRCLWGWRYGLYQLTLPPHPRQRWYGPLHSSLESGQIIPLINKPLPLTATQRPLHQQHHTHTAVFHLTLSLGCQVGAPADDLTVLPSSAEQSATPQGAQGEHAAFMGSGLSHDLEGLCGK